jgi:biopolymer transport protein ExbB
MVVSLLTRAGILIWPIILCSIIGLGLTINRLLFFRAARAQNRAVLRAVMPLMRGGEHAEAEELCRAARGPVAATLAVLLEAWDLPADHRQALVAEAMERQLRVVEQGMRPMAVIARISPLLGLLGTVLGLVQSFIAFSNNQGPPDPAQLAGGIWQALLTTVAGLVVAIPAIMVVEWCEDQADAQLMSMRQTVVEIEAWRR